MTKEKTTENTITYHSTPTAPTTDDSTTTKQQQMTTPTDPTAGNIIITGPSHHENTKLRVCIHEILYNNI